LQKFVEMVDNGGSKGGARELGGSLRITFTLFKIVVTITLFGTLSVNFLFHSVVLEDKVKSKISRLSNPVQIHLDNFVAPLTSTTTDLNGLLNQNYENNKVNHQLASLSCNIYGGPSNDYAQQEMVYWEDIPSDDRYISPFKKAKGNKIHYLTFEPDHGGWNNIRMAMETVVVMAHAMGRTLVLPPSQNMYLLDQGGKEHKKEFGFEDFFHLDSINSEHEGLDIISMEEFLKREGITGRLIDPKSQEPLLPPQNKTDWNGQDRNAEHLWDYLRKVGHVRNWQPWECLAAFPASADASNIAHLHDMLNEIKSGKRMPDPADYNGKPLAVDAPDLERLKESMGGGGREEICVYDELMQKQTLVHFQVDKSESSRLLTHFYAFLFFEDWRQDLFYKRFVRDHIRYIDEIMCAAARIIQAIRERAIEHNSENAGANGDYDAFHIRRGDFQYKKTRITADQLHEFSKDEMTEGSTLYIATDEKNKSFFGPLATHYNLLYLDDFIHLIPNLNANYHGMLEQLICAKSRIFFGTWFSTFSGYINRIRGKKCAGEIFYA